MTGNINSTESKGALSNFLQWEKTNSTQFYNSDPGGKVPTSRNMYKHVYVNF